MIRDPRRARSGASKPRVATVIPDPDDPGGITRMVDVWLLAGVTDRANITLIPMSSWDASRPRQLWQAIRGFFRLARLLAGRRVDLVHVHVSSGGSLYRKAVIAGLSRAFRVPVVTQLHSGGFAAWIKSSRTGWRVARWVFSRSAATVVMAQTWVELAHELGASDVVVIPHVLPAELDARLSRVALRRRRDRSDHSNPVFLYYGRWAESKGVDILADALRRIGDVAPEPELRVFGNGDRKWLEHCFDDVRSARVHLGAWLSDDDKLRELEIATALVYPSRVEAFGQTLLEAMRAGVPIITTEAGAIPEVVTGYPLALMVPPGDSSALAAALRDVIEHRWPPEPTGDSFERTSRSEAVALIGALYERLSTKRSHHAA